MKDLWYGTSGPRDAQIVIVGEAWGQEEAALERPFVGSSGVELNRMLAEAGIDRNTTLCTNVAAVRPQNNEMWRLFEPKVAKPIRLRGLAPTLFVREELARLQQQIAAHPRRLVIAVGNYALWALTDCTGSVTLTASNNRPIPSALQTWAPNGIGKWRGSMWYMLADITAAGNIYSDVRALPLIHPAAILRQWEQRAITVHDLKARVPKALRGDWRPNPIPVFWAPPTFEQAKSRFNYWLSQAESGKKILLAEDIETRSSLITCIGFADSTHFAMCVPLVRRTAEGLVSWWTLEEEAELIRLIAAINSHPNIDVCGQNFLYDTQYIQHYFLTTPRLVHDTMLAQNVIFPGTPKALDYLSSLYCEYYWFWKEDSKEWDEKGTIEQLLVYNCQDCVNTWEVAHSQRGLLKQLQLEAAMAFKMEVNAFCLSMMNRGIKVDAQRRHNVRLELFKKVEELKNELRYIVPQDFITSGGKSDWWNSSKQKAEVLYELLRMSPIAHRKTGNLTVAKEALDELTRKYPIWAGLLARLDLIGSASNTLNVLNAGIDNDGRMRCFFQPGGTETHRLSSAKNVFGRGTNLQNLTKGDEE